MALTKPSFNNINTATSQAYFNDTQLTLNYGNVTANNQDIGIVLNRGSSGNVAIIWSETTKGFVLAYTPSSGLTSGNITVTANANLRVGNLEVSGVTTYRGGITGTDLTLSGNLTVNGSTVTVNATTLTVNDKNIVVANNQSTSSGIDGAGIDAGGGTPIATLRYNHATTSWQSNVTVMPVANNTISLGGTSNYWNNIYAATHTGTTGSFTGTLSASTVTAATVNAATIGNAGAVITGNTGSFTTSVTTAAVNAATIGNTGATLFGTTANISNNASVVGNLTVGNLLATGYFYANGAAFAGGGSGTPGGSNGQVQYNNNGLFGGAAGLTTNGSNLTVVAGIQNTPIGNVTANTGAFTTISATGTFTGTTINAATIGNAGAAFTGASVSAATIGNVGAAHIGASVSAATIGNTGSTLTGTIQTAAQTNITSVGTLTGLTLSGTLTGTTINAATIGNAGATLTGSTVNAATIGNTGASLVGNLSNAITVNNGGAGAASGSTYNNGGTLTISHNSIGAAPQAGNTSIVTVGNITSGTWSATLGSISGANLTSLTASNLSGTIPSAVLGKSTHYIGTTAITLNRASAAQSLTGVSIDGSAGSATTATNLAGGGAGQIPYQTASGTTAMLAAGTTGYVLTSNGTSAPSWSAIPVGLKFTTASAAPSTPNAGDFWYDTTANILYQRINTGITTTWVDQSTIPTTYNTLTVTGNATVNTSLRVNSNNNVTAIVNLGTSGTGNIGASGATFNTVFAKATTAQYADLAENYLADSWYSPGTVVVFGGEREITTSDLSHDSRVAGVISTNPGFLMNEGQTAGSPVAFTGRVPCRVQGPVSKGDVLVNIGKGIAGKLDAALYNPGCILGKSLESIPDFEIKTIEVVVGRF